MFLWTHRLCFLLLVLFLLAGRILLERHLSGDHEAARQFVDAFHSSQTATSSSSGISGQEELSPFSNLRAEDQAAVEEQEGPGEEEGGPLAGKGLTSGEVSDELNAQESEERPESSGTEE